MSNNWIDKFIGAPKGPNGLYNNSDLLGGVNDTKIRTNFWPGGDFDNTAGPLSSLKNANGKMSQMSKNLMSNQTIMVQYIHIPRIILPLWIPQIGQQRGLIDLVKSVTSGDVLFNLRYNDDIMKAGLGSKIIRKEGGDSVFSINLPTMNYILMGIQNYLEKFRDACVAHADDRNVFDQIQNENRVAANARRIPNPYNQHDQYLLWLNLVTNDDFRHLMNSNFFEGWIAFENISKIELSQEELTPFYNRYVCSILWDFINTYAKLAGVFVGSDNQGGNHYGMANPCSYAPTDYVGVIQAAGKNMKVRNLWANCENGTSNGDLVGFRFMKFDNTLGSNISFKLSSNVDTQNDQHIQRSPNSCHFLLVPAKRYTQTSSHVKREQWVDSHFLQFGICDQISRPCANSSTNLLHVATNATFVGIAAPIQISFRFDFCRLSAFVYSDTPKISLIPAKTESVKRRGDIMASGVMVDSDLLDQLEHAFAATTEVELSTVDTSDTTEVRVRAKRHKKIITVDETIGMEVQE